MKDMGRRIGVGVFWNLGSLFLTQGACMIFILFLVTYPP